MIEVINVTGICDYCLKDIIGEVVTSSSQPGEYHLWCAISLEKDNDPSDYMAFMDDAKQYARDKGE